MAEVVLKRLEHFLYFLVRRWGIVGLLKRAVVFSVAVGILIIVVIARAETTETTFYPGQEEQILEASRRWSGINIIILEPGEYSSGETWYIDSGKVISARGARWTYAGVDNAVTILGDSVIFSGVSLDCPNFARAAVYVGCNWLRMDGIEISRALTGVWVDVGAIAVINGGVLGAIEHSVVANSRANVSIFNSDLRQGRIGFWGRGGSVNILDGCELGEGFNLAVKLDTVAYIGMVHNIVEGDSLAVLMRGGVDSSLIVNNIFHQQFLGGIYCWDAASDRGIIKIINNVFDGFATATGGNAVWLKNCASRINIDNNVIENGHCGIGSLTPMADTVGEYNLFYGITGDNMWNVLLKNFVVADPLLDTNYIPFAGSPCINAGKLSTIFSNFDDPDGSRNDVGAYGGRWAYWNGFSGAYPLGIVTDIDGAIWRNGADVFYPNPFNSVLEIEARAKESVKIFSLDGRMVWGALASDSRVSETGREIFEWRPGMDLPSGVYLVKFSGGGYVFTMPVVYLK